MRGAVAAGLLLALGLGCGVQRAGLYERDRFVAPSSLVQVRWRRHLTEEPLIEYKPQEFAAAFSDGEHVFIGSSAGSVYALRAVDGEVLWRKKLGGGIGGRPTLAPNEQTLYVGAGDGGLYALDTQTGAERWVYKAKGPIDAQPVYADGMVYFTSGENRVYAVDAVRGTWKWQYDREAPESFTIRGYAAPLVLKGRVYVGFSDGYLAALSAAGGEVVWARSLAGEATRFTDVDGTPLFFNGSIFVSSYSGGVYALDPKDGSTRWRYDVEGAGTVRTDGQRLYFTAAKSGLHCLDADGHLVYRQALAEAGELSAPTLTSGYILISASGGGTYVADAHTGALLSYFSPGHGVTAEATSDGRQIYVLSNGGYFYALSLSRS
jgi:outer membrane protein assembly factor BamB